MIEDTPYSIDSDLLTQAQTELPKISDSENKISIVINQPNENFFYDPWTIKEEFKNTVWEKILDTLPKPIGEARIIVLKHGTCYMSHCDIDDRYHLNLDGQYSFLIDVDSQKMFPTVADKKWYIINTGNRHVAANFGSVKRTQLVVRKLLNKAALQNPVAVKINPICENPRFEFDDIVSPWLHKMNKTFCLSDFTVLDDGVKFKMEEIFLDELNLFPKSKFKITVEK